MRIEKDQTLGVVIDIQERLFPHIHQNDALLKKSQILLQGLQALKVPLLVTQQYTKGLGETVEPIKSILEQSNYIEKKAFSCCDDTSFSGELSEHNRKNVILIGIESHICVLQTAIDLKSKGYQAIVVEDCVSSRNENDKKIAIERLRYEGAIITTTESILLELARYSGTPEFKVISKLIK